MVQKLPIVFLGPSLPIATAQKLLDADYRPPAAQGDIFRACTENPPAIGLIDGVFKDIPTVRHREILWALSQGIPLYGASSMGALRAAELSAHGMIGVGLIYRWYRRFDLLPDDAVAVTHAPRELGSRPLSDALVDIRRSIRRAERQGAISHAEACDITESLSRKAFAKRYLPEHVKPFRVSQKANDAEKLLRVMVSCASTGIWPTPKAEAPPIVHAWIDDLTDSGLTPPT